MDRLLKIIIDRLKTDEKSNNTTNVDFLEFLRCFLGGDRILCKNAILYMIKKNNDKKTELTNIDL